MISNKIRRNHLKELKCKLKLIGLMVLCLCSFNLFLVSSVAYAGGATIITHGFNSDVTSWIDYMESAISWRLVDVMEEKEGRDISGTELATLSARYIVKITKEPGNLVNYDYIGDYQGFYWGIQHVGVSMAESGSGEVVILIDWSDLDTLGFEAIGTRDVAFLVRLALTSPDAVSAFGGSPLSVPIHLIGHSRGGSLVGSLAEYFGEANIWVDQVTFLDPHPISINGMENDWGNDSGMAVTDNVRFADNYFREGAVFEPNGESVIGAVNHRLNDDFFEENGWGGYSGSLVDRHADVHLWYHGTIDISAGITDGSASINSEDVVEWYNWERQMPDRYSRGYNFSRIVGKDRSALGLANNGNRVVVENKSDIYANLDAPLTFGTSSPVTIGNDISIDYRYQALDDCSISFGFDEDPNPFNNNEDYIGSPINCFATSNGTIFDNGTSSKIDIETSSKSPGSYYLVAKITGSAGYTRYVHSSKVVELVKEDPPPGPEPDFREPNDSWRQATDLGRVSGEESFTADLSIDRAGDVDYFKFEIIATGTSEHFVGFYLKNAGNGGAGSGRGIYDLDLAIGKLNNSNQLIPANGGRWINSINDSYDQTSTISIEGYEPGVYYVIVFGGSGFDDVSEDAPDFDFSNGTEESDYNLLVTGPLPKVNTPVIVPNGGEFTGPKQVILSCPDHPDADIRYTTNGANPTASSTLYNGSFTLSSAATVKAIAIKSNYANSDLASSASFTFVPELSATPISLNVSANGATDSFNIDNTGSGTMPWTALVISGGDWLSIKSGASGTDSGTINIEFLANASGSARTGTIQVTASGAAGRPIDINVIQNTLELVLNSGWNLISLPLHPTDTDITVVLSSISGKYLSVWAYDNGLWKAYDPASPEFSDLLTLEAGIGYWINMTESDELTVTGTIPLNSISLSTDWNLVGYDSTVSQPIGDALTSIANKYISVWTLINDEWKAYDPNNTGSSTLTTMEAGYAYWINMSEGAEWTLP